MGKLLLGILELDFGDTKTIGRVLDITTVLTIINQFVGVVSINTKIQFIFTYIAKIHGETVIIIHKDIFKFHFFIF